MHASLKTYLITSFFFYFIEVFYLIRAKRKTSIKLMYNGCWIHFVDDCTLPFFINGYISTNVWWWKPNYILNRNIKKICVSPVDEWLFINMCLIVPAAADEDILDEWGGGFVGVARVSEHLQPTNCHEPEAGGQSSYCPDGVHGPRWGVRTPGRPTSAQRLGRELFCTQEGPTRVPRSLAWGANALMMKAVAGVSLNINWSSY